MATWKKIFTTSDVVPVENGGTGTNALAAGNVVSNGTVLQSLEQDTGRFLIGQGTSAAPAATALAGDISTVTAGGAVTIANDAITTAKIINSAVTLPKMADGTKGQIISFAADGSPLALGVGDNTKVLTADSNEATGLKWVTAGGASTINVQNGDTSPGTALPVVFASDVSATASVYADADELTFDAAGVTFTHLDTTDLGVSDGNLTSELDGAGRAALFSQNGFKGDLAGRASAANFTQANNTFTNTTNNTNLTGTVNILGTQSSTVDGNYYQPQSLGARVTYDVSSDTLSVQNLTVAGTTTTINSTTTTIADPTIRIAEGTSTSGSYGASAAAAGGAGIVVDNGTASDENLGRFIYTGYDAGTTNNASVLGWKIAQEKSTNAGEAANGPYGVGVMYVQSTAMDTDGNGVDINPGAMLFTSNDDSLWIQIS